jgi:putative oxidoreductase
MLLRLTVGGLFMAHGAQKLFGWFGGPGLEQTGQFFEQGMQMAPGKRNALAAGVSELGGGTLIVTGAATPLATTALTSTMVTAIWKVHKDKGFFTSEGGFEFNLVLIAALALLADEGPGPLSVGRDEGGGTKAALFSLAAGTAGAFAAMEVAKREAARMPSAAGPSGNGGSAASTPSGAPAPASA